MTSMESFAGLARIAFGIVFFLKIFISLDAKNLVWCHALKERGMNETLLRVSIWTLLGVTLFFTAGLMTPYVALLLWLLYMLLFLQASLFCLEDIVLTYLSFYFVFAGSGASFSLDSYFGWTHAWGRIPTGTLFPELCLLIVFGLVFFSAGWEKLKSPIWKKGLGCYYFFLLPNVRRFDTSFITDRKWIMFMGNYLTLSIELGFLLILFFNFWPLGLLTWFGALMFIMSLWIIFVVHWIGEGELIALFLIFGLFWTQSENSGFELLLNEFTRGGYFQITLGSLFLGSLIPCLWTVFFRSPPSASGWQTIHRFLRSSARYTWGFLPVRAFTEMNLQGPVVYRIVAKDEHGREREAWPIFREDATPGPVRRFKPTFFETMAYKVTEICEELDRFGKVKTPERKHFFESLMHYIRDGSEGYLGSVPDHLIVKIIQIDPPEEYIGYSEWYLEDGWKDAFRVDFSNGQTNVEKLSDPILDVPTGRDLDRMSFEFNPDQA